ncbi:MAG TPA: hypothetical protein VN436_09090, partial [Holophaga sp.]|nr:hypothetical protein [Holophaga sp.]
PETPAPTAKRGRPKKTAAEPVPKAEAPARKGRKAAEPKADVAEPAPAPRKPRTRTVKAKS